MSVDGAENNGAVQPSALSTDGGVLFDRPPDRALRAAFIRADPVETIIDNTPELSCAGTNTTRGASRSVGMLHSEGAWPASVDAAEAEERFKYVKRVQREEQYFTRVSQLLALINTPLRINAALDIYATHFDGGDGHFREGGGFDAGEADSSAGTGGDGDDASLRTKRRGGADLPSDSHRSVPNKYVRRQYTASDAEQVAVTHRLVGPSSPDSPKRAARSITWLYGGSDSERRLLVSYDAAADSTDDDTAAALWDLAHCGASPLAWLRSASPITASASHPKDHHLVVVGLENGVVAVYDLRGAAAGGGAAIRPFVSANTIRAHCGAVMAVRCTIGKSIEFLSAGSDGRVLYWDARNLSAPLDVLTLTAVANTAEPAAAVASDVLLRDAGATAVPATHSVTCLDYDAVAAASAKLLVGTAEGAVLLCSRSGGVTRSGGDRVAGRINAHYGPVRDVTRHPFTAKTFACVGDWGFAVFCEDVRVPIIQSAYHSRRLVAGKWHPARPAVLVTVDESGALGVWDLLHGASTPVIQRSLLVGGDSSAPTAITVRPDGRVVAIAESSGAVNIVTLPSVVATCTDRLEKAAMAALIEHATLRERAVIAAMESKAAKASPNAAPPRRDALTSTAAPDSAPLLDRGDPSVDPAIAAAVAKAASDFLAVARAAAA